MKRVSHKTDTQDLRSFLWSSVNRPDMFVMRKLLGFIVFCITIPPRAYKLHAFWTLRLWEPLLMRDVAPKKCFQRALVSQFCTRSWMKRVSKQYNQFFVTGPEWKGVPLKNRPGFTRFLAIPSNSCSIQYILIYIYILEVPKTP